MFFRFEKDDRVDSKFPKAHFKFFFNSIYKNEDQDGYILLDAVFEENPYLNLDSRVIRGQILPTIDPYLAVNLPSITVKSLILCKIIYVSLGSTLVDPLFCFVSKLYILTRTGLPFFVDIN